MSAFYAGTPSDDDGQLDHVRTKARAAMIAEAQAERLEDPAIDSVPRPGPNCAVVGHHRHTAPVSHQAPALAVRGIGRGNTHCHRQSFAAFTGFLAIASGSHTAPQPSARSR